MECYRRKLCKNIKEYMLSKNIRRCKIKIVREYWILCNKMKLKINNIQFGLNCALFNSLYIRNNGNICIGDNFLMTSMGGYNPLCRNIRGAIIADKKANIRIGNHVHVSSPCIWARKSIVIGNDVKIGGDSIIIDSDAHSLNFLDRRIGRDDDDSRNACSREVVIGNDVLIGTRCIILKGVHIGDRSVIGAGSVVTTDIPADTIAAGNPCRVIRKINE